MDDDGLVQHFESDRGRLVGVAKRLLSSESEAHDAVQESWLRLSRADRTTIENVSGWLTTTVARICFDILRARKTRDDDRDHVGALESVAVDEDVASPEIEAMRAESVGLALAVILEALKPTERVAFVLHDSFDVPFQDIALVVGCSVDAARQLAARARRRVRNAACEDEAKDIAQSRRAVEAFLVACRTGDVAELLAILAPDVVLTPDRAALLMSAANQGRGGPMLAPEVRGAALVAEAFAGRAAAAQLALVGGHLGAVWMVGSMPRVVFSFTLSGGTVTAIDVIADSAHIARLGVVALDA